MIDDRTKNDTPDTANDEVLYEYVIDEMEQQTTAKGIWAKAVAHSDGDAEKTKSLYMRYKVQSIKDSFALYGVAYDGLSKDEIGAIVKDDFKDLQEAYKIKQETQTKKEDEKYEKIGGWLYLFAFKFVVGIVLAFVNIFMYFGDEYAANLEIVYKTYPEASKYFDMLAYFDFAFLCILIVLYMAFFSKSTATKSIAIVFFVFLSINSIYAVYAYGQIGITSNEMIQDIFKMIGETIWSVVFILYFMYSKRVKKTFVKQVGEIEQKSVAVLTIILFIFMVVTYNDSIKSIVDKDASIYGNNDKVMFDKIAHNGIEYNL